MQIDFQDQTDVLSDQQIGLIEKLLHFSAERECVQSNAELSVSFVDKHTIQELNKTYRGKDEPTDVISFALQDHTGGGIEIVGENSPLILGDMVISIDQTKEQALAYDHSFERELGFLVVHGFLHLLGYNHLEEEEEKVMFKKQTDILDDFGLER